MNTAKLIAISLSVPLSLFMTYEIHDGIRSSSAQAQSAETSSYGSGLPEYYTSYIEGRVIATPRSGDLRQEVSQDFTNGGFETGDFTGWLFGDNGIPPLDPWQVCPAFFCGFFGNEPVEGEFDALNGFDGDAGYEAFLFQELEIPIEGGSVFFADRIQYDSLGIPSFLPRIYEVQVRDTAGRILEVLHREEILLNGQPYTDLGWREREFDVSSYASSIIRIHVNLFIPESFTGPASFEVDNFRFEPGVGGPVNDCEVELSAIPNPALSAYPFVLEMDFANLGNGFDAVVEVLVISGGHILPLRTENNISFAEETIIREFPFYSTLSLMPLPPSAGFLITVYNQDNRALICSDVIVVGVGMSVASTEVAEIEALAKEYLQQAKGPLNQ